MDIEFLLSLKEEHVKNPNLDDDYRRFIQIKTGKVRMQLLCKIVFTLEYLILRYSYLERLTIYPLKINVSKDSASRTSVHFKAYIKFSFHLNLLIYSQHCVHIFIFQGLNQTEKAPDSTQTAVNELPGNIDNIVTRLQYEIILICIQ